MPWVSSPRAHDPRVPALGCAVKQFRGERPVVVLTGEIEIRPAFLGALEAGEVPVTFALLCRVADALGVRPHMLVERAEEIAS